METASVLALLRSKMAQATQMDVQEEPLWSAVVRLAKEGAFLLQTGRHAWVRRRVSGLADASNWPAYAMEVHLAHALESAGLSVESSVGLIPGDESDVDFVYRHSNGVQVNAECVLTCQPQSYWQEKRPAAPGITLLSARYDGDGEAGLLRRIQSKLRIKTIREDGRPLKFPPASATSVNLLIADVTKGAGFRLDWNDLLLLAHGQDAVEFWYRRPLLGLFETRNPYQPDFTEEFQQNRYLRERVSGLVFLIDRSTWAGPLDPAYEGRDCICNPSLSLSQDQLEAIAAVFGALSSMTAG